MPAPHCRIGHLNQRLGLRLAYGRVERGQTGHTLGQAEIKTQDNLIKRGVSAWSAILDGGGRSLVRQGRE